MTSVLPGRRSDVKFEISAAAADVIRRRGGALWIWPSPDRSAYATTEPPGDSRAWTVYRHGELVVHVDREIVPPQRWVVALPNHEGRHLDAWWNGDDPRAAGRLPLVDPPGQEPETTGITRWLQLVFGVLALVAGVFWILGIAGVLPGWSEELDAARLGVAVLAALIGSAGSWILRRVSRE